MQTHAISAPRPTISDKIRLKRARSKALQILNREYRIVLSEFDSARTELNLALTDFDCLSDPAAVDVCIHRINYAHSRCDNSIKQLKALQRKIADVELN